MTRFYISDLHYDHTNILTFKNTDGTPIRNFKNLEEMQATITHRWNNVVTNNDTVYVLGDITLGQSTKCLSFLEMLRGTKVLIRGNHDGAKATQYLKYFKDIRAYDVKPGIICSHIPIHPGSLARFGTNVHGHLHSNIVTREAPKQIGEQFIKVQVPDNRYFNVSCEQINYTPISYEELLLKIKERT